ncbi:chorismate mutase [Gallaecimonas pentaromativorans]|uniref:chorismate mutase n=1 Tax=Gallaecimonas pentaromativorans TaxID=584787 RepID=UPI00067E7F4B|nr:chorismate mutase [Gallaecimonas pentaromativorans]
MADLSALRQQIEEIDNRLLALLSQRLLVADELGELKGGRVFDPAREFALVEQHVESFTELPAPLVRQFSRDLISLCRARQGPFRIASLQPPLVHALLGRYTQILPSDAPFEAVFEGQAQGVLWLGDLPDSLAGLLPAATFAYEGQQGFLLTAQGANSGTWQLSDKAPGQGVGARWFLIPGHQFDAWPLLSED